MRFITRELLEDVSHGEEQRWADAWSAYHSHLDSFRETLPPALLDFVSPGALHDALFDLVEIDLVKRTLHLRLLTSDGKLLDLDYADTDFGASNLRNLRIAVEAVLPLDKPGIQSPVSGYPIGQILYTEIDVRGDRIQHSFLIDPLGDFAVQFSRFECKISSTTTKELPERPNRFLLRNRWTDD